MAEQYINGASDVNPSDNIEIFIKAMSEKLPHLDMKDPDVVKSLTDLAGHEVGLVREAVDVATNPNFVDHGSLGPDGAWTANEASREASGKITQQSIEDTVVARANIVAGQIVYSAGIDMGASGKSPDEAAEAYAGSLQNAANVINTSKQYVSEAGNLGGGNPYSIEVGERAQLIRGFSQGDGSSFDFDPESAELGAIAAGKQAVEDAEEMFNEGGSFIAKADPNPDLDLSQHSIKVSPAVVEAYLEEVMSGNNWDPRAMAAEAEQTAKDMGINLEVVEPKAPCGNTPLAVDFFGAAMGGVTKDGTIELSKGDNMGVDNVASGSAVHGLGLESSVQAFTA